MASRSPGMQSTCLLQRHLGQWFRKPPRTSGNTCVLQCSQTNPWLVLPTKFFLSVIAHPLGTSVVASRGGVRFALPRRVPGWRRQRPIHRQHLVPAVTFGSGFLLVSQPGFRTLSGFALLSRSLPSASSYGWHWSPIGVALRAPASASSPTGAMTDAVVSQHSPPQRVSTGIIHHVRQERCS